MKKPTKHSLRVSKGSNSHGRRRYARLMASGRNVDTKMKSVKPVITFGEGQEVKITSDQYGQRYFNTKGVIIGPASQPNHWLVSSKRRASPLTVLDTHLVKVAAKVKAA